MRLPRGTYDNRRMRNPRQAERLPIPKARYRNRLADSGQGRDRTADTWIFSPGQSKTETPAQKDVPRRRRAGIGSGCERWIGWGKFLACQPGTFSDRAVAKRGPQGGRCGTRTCDPQLVELVLQPPGLVLGGTKHNGTRPAKAYGFPVVGGEKDAAECAPGRGWLPTGWERTRQKRRPQRSAHGAGRELGGDGNSIGLLPA